MPAKPRHRITRRLSLILVILALVQLLLGGIPLFYISYNNQQQAIRSAQQQAVDRAALAIDAYLSSATGRMEAFISDYDKGILIQGMERPEAVYGARELLEWEGFLEVWLLDGQGNEILQSSYKRFVNPNLYTSRADAPEYTSLLTGQPYYISPIHLSPDPALASLPLATISVPIRINEALGGVLVVELDTREIQEIISNLSLSPESYAYIVDQEGVLRVHWSDTRVVLQEKSLSHVPGVQASLTGQQEVPFYPGINPERTGQVLGSWASLERTDWIVILEQPVREAMHGLRQITFVFAGLLAVSVVVAAGVGLLMARQNLKHLHVLQEGAELLGTGELGHRIDIRTEDEFAVLADTFNEMAARVQSSHDAIEAKVQERTLELSEAYEQLRRQSAEQGRLLETIRQMSVPVVPVLQGVVVMPLVGSIDTERAHLVTEALLAGIRQYHAQIVILDITGLSVVDTAVANTLLQAMQAASLLGVRPILVGIKPEVAQTVVNLGVDLSGIDTRSTLQAGVAHAIRLLLHKG
ncbi:MAG: STAS domain-containing protein [Chloroflexia bacterium]|nr:STAS domain-containing protein [Chloroflexia bacterium]